MAHKNKKQRENRSERRIQAEKGRVHVASGMSGDSSREELTCFGVNLYDYRWESTGRIAAVKDPLYGTLHKFPVYTAVIGEKKREFAFGEYCMCIYGLYARQY
ncbi:MAG: hypothetical protein IKQ39_02450 [Oscillospiraceae bacterium]|nr:hypothetical protein [Oscillospiraceae bacterium]